MDTTDAIYHVTRAVKSKTSIHIGVVSNVSPFFVEVEGAAIEAPKRLAGYTPIDGDTVLVLTLNDVFIVLDKVV